jgi:CPA2 family monovalent cation:H+ antiporter-2
MHTVSGLKDIALVVTAALGGGLLFERRFKQPAVLGYILAGILLGPSGLGFLTDTSTIRSCADLGILMVLFLVGMDLNLRGFKESLSLSVATASLQIVAGLAVAFVIGSLSGWPVDLSILVGFLVSLSSTAVVVKILEGRKGMSTEAGRLTVAILIAQDLAIVPMILVLKEMDDSINWVGLGFKLFFTLGLLSWLVWFLSRRQRVHLFFTFSFDKPELPSLVGLAFCFGFATISGFLDLSVAYGAFLAGLILGNSRERNTMLQVMAPIYSILVMTFFLSIGLLFDLPFIWKNLWTVVGLASALLLGKTLLNIAILKILRQSWRTALVCGGILAQIGEFSFLLISLGDEMRIVSREHQQLLVTLTTLSLAFSPLWISLLDRWGEPFLNWIKRLKKQTSPGLLSVVEDTPAPGHPKNKEM